MADLTTLARTKAYLGGNLPVTSDAVISALISRASDMAVQFTSRDFAQPQHVSMRVNGTGTPRLMAPHNPIVRVDQLMIDERVIPFSSNAVAFGYQFDQKFLYLFGGAVFTRGFRNIALDFGYGYETEEVGIIPDNPGPYTLAPDDGNQLGGDGQPADTSGPASFDHGVIYTATGLPLTRITVGNLSVGKYKFSDGTYTFDNADKTLSVTMSYDFVPGSVEQAVLEIVGHAFERRKQLGISSRSLAGETVTYDQEAMTTVAKQLLQPYRYVISP